MLFSVPRTDHHHHHHENTCDERLQKADMDSCQRRRSAEDAAPTFGMSVSATGTRSIALQLADFLGLFSFPANPTPLLHPILMPQYSLDAHCYDCRASALFFFVGAFHMTGKQCNINEPERAGGEKNLARART